jgi:hypothetical protein
MMTRMTIGTKTTTRLLAGCAAVLALDAPALALNPQPLPPGLYHGYLPHAA